MKAFITALAIVFALATGTSVLALIVHTDSAHIDQHSPHTAGHQKLALVF